MYSQDRGKSMFEAPSCHLKKRSESASFWLCDLSGVSPTIVLEWSKIHSRSRGSLDIRVKLGMRKTVRLSLRKKA